MARLNGGPSTQPGAGHAAPPPPAPGRASRRRAPTTAAVLDEVESVARIGSYTIDLRTGGWVSSRGLDTIFGITQEFERSVESWASLIHPSDRDAMVAYFTDDVVGRGHPFDRWYRIVRADTGEERWVHGLGALQLDASGRPIRMVGTIADVTSQRLAQEAVTAAALRYAAIFEGSPEAILIADAEGRRFRWVNRAACSMFGYARTELLGLTIEDIHPPGDFSMVAKHLEALTADSTTISRAVPCRRRDGSTFLADIAGSSTMVDGRPCLIGFFTDVTQRVAAEEERGRLEEGLRASGRNLAEAQRIAQIGSWEWDLTTGLAHRSDELNRIFGVESGAMPATAEAFLDYVHPDDRARVQQTERAATTGEGRYALEYRALRPDGTVRLIRDDAELIRDEHGAPSRLVGTVRDITDQVAADVERVRLATAVEQTSDAVVIADLAGVVLYANPAFETMSGYRREDVVGQNPRLVNSGRQSAAFYRTLWARLTSGQAWTGRFVNRTAAGTLYEVEATISPIRSTGGEITGYVAVERDVTALQAAISSLADEFRERAQVAAALSRLQPAGSAEETAAEICDELIGLSGVDVAAIVNFVDRERAIPLAVRGPDGLPISPGRTIVAASAAYLYERALQGPWAEAWEPETGDGAFGRALADAGIRAIAYAPIRNGDGLLGLVAAGTSDERYARHLIDHLPAVGEFAATASALLSGQLEGDHRRSRRREELTDKIVREAFHPVFQPIVDLGSGMVVGWEALTRFADDTPPDRQFAEAWAVGLGADLELAALRAAVRQARSLPAGRWLNLNVSPSLLDDPVSVRAVLAAADRPVVLEITEHDTIADYAALRAAIGGLGESVRVAVDDAGAGIANFAHIVELRPDFVKLDLALVRGVDTDPGRQALVVAMRHFAQITGCRLIAEGVETAAEARSLVGLGVDFGQGYWYGRPATIDALTAARRGPAGRRESPSSSRVPARVRTRQRRPLRDGEPREIG